MLVKPTLLRDGVDIKKLSIVLSCLCLFAGETEQSLEDQVKAATIKSEIVSHWHPNLTINIGRILTLCINSEASNNRCHFILLSK